MDTAIEEHEAVPELPILEDAPDPVIVIDEHGLIQSFNRAACEAFGYAVAEVVGRNVSMLMPSPDRERHDSYLSRYGATREPRIIGVGREVTARRKDGRQFPVRLAISEAQVGGRRLFTGFLQNLTAQKEAEAALARERDQLESILRTAPDPVIVIDEYGIVLSFNAAAVRSFGYAPEEVVGRNVSMLMPPPDRERHDSYLARYLDSGEAHIIGIGREVTARRKDGTTFAARLAISEARVGARRFFTGFLQDLSEQRRAEGALRDSEGRLRETQAQLFHAARHGEIGEMASAIAHELNQPLTAVLNYVQTIRDALGAVPGVPPRTVEHLQRAAAQAERAGLIIRRLRQLYERGDAELVPDDLNAAVREALDIALIGTGEQGIAVTVDLARGLPDVLIDRQQIQQVVINLVRNAVEALTGCERRELSVATRSGPDGTVELAVSDSGPGLPREISDHLFSPFRTTKATGMGLGLSICRTIVEGHDGRIGADSHPGRGTTFVVSLKQRGGEPA